MHDVHQQQPTRMQSLAFAGKVKCFQAKRVLNDVVSNVKKYSQSQSLTDAPIVGQSSTPLWTEGHAAEQNLTAGKIQNLRVACRALDGVVIPAGEVFSFWKQTGRTTRGKGYVVGRELREGCLIPNLGGGLCQLSNALYNAALKAGFQIIERHAHSQHVPGSLAAVGRDATVFWNYVDLRFSHQADFRIEARLSKNHLHLRFRSLKQAQEESAPVVDQSSQPDAIGNCYSCNISSCFRNDPQEENDEKLGRAAILLDSYVPEFQTYLEQQDHSADTMFCPIHAQRFRAPAYRWKNPTRNPAIYATALTLARSLRLRYLPSEGGALQRTLMQFDRKLAEWYARRIDYRTTHLIVSQNLLPHLWQLGVMGGRTFDVLANRYAMSEIQSKLDEAYKLHPTSSTLHDFRVDERISAAETQALASARKIITAHCGVAATMPGEVVILPWDRPEPESRTSDSGQGTGLKTIGFPASPLGKKGIYELVDAVLGLDAELLILGQANEGLAIPNSRRANLSELLECDVLVMPAYIEHSPRLLIRALAQGTPVIATEACGLPAQKGLMLISRPDDTLIRQALDRIFK
ncbi:hypothetical protein NT6N_36880 [Oceaniferula spumae]|uniref:Vanw family protein n=1 Tax=Oceaniferula spumae TaxID=2979115 RepID=A0AAT9FRQ2_9BACT